MRDEERGRVTARSMPSGGMDVPMWGIEGFGGASRAAGTIDRSDGTWGSVRRMGSEQGFLADLGGGNGSERFRGRGQAQPQVQVRALAPNGTAPGDVNQHNAAALVAIDRPLLDERIYQPDDETEQLPTLKTIRIPPCAVSRDRRSDSSHQ